MNLPLIPEPDLMLGGMDVHIHLRWREANEERHHRITTPFQKSPVSLEHGVLHHPIPDEAAIDIGIDEPRRGAVRLGPPHQTRHPALSLAVLNGIKSAGKGPPQQGSHPLLEITRSHREDDLAVADIGKTDVRTGQSQTIKELPHMSPLGIVPPEKLQPRRSIKEEIAYRDDGSPGHAARLYLLYPPPLGVNLGPLDTVPHPAGQGQT